MVYLKLIIALFTLSGMIVSCASGGSRFGKIYPGMKAEQVVKDMEKGPSETQKFDDGYSAWYFGENHCLLMRNDKVVSKDKSETKGSIEVFGMGGVTQKRPAECVPPDHKRTKKIVRKIETPIGTISR